MVNRRHGKSGEVNTCSIVKHDIGGNKEARYIEGHGKSGHGKSGEVITCSIVKHDIGGNKEAGYIKGHGKSGARYIGGS